MRGRSRLGRTVRNRGKVEDRRCGKWIGVRNTLLLLDKRSDYQSKMIVEMDMFMNQFRKLEAPLCPLTKVVYSGGGSTCRP